MEGQCVKWLHLDYGMIRSLDHRKWSGSTFVGAHLYQRRLQARITWFVNDPLPCPFLGFLLLMMITFLGTHRLPTTKLSSRQKKFIKKLCGSCACNQGERKFVDMSYDIWKEIFVYQNCAKVFAFLREFWISYNHTYLHYIFYVCISSR